MKSSIAVLLGVAVGVVAALSFGVFAATTAPATRDVMVLFSGVPQGSTVDVWGGSVSAGTTHGSQKLDSVSADRPVTVHVPSDIDDIQFTARPLLRAVYDEKLGRSVTEEVEPGIRYVAEKPQYALLGITRLDVGFKKQYWLSLGTSATVRGIDLRAADSARDLVSFEPASPEGWYDVGASVTLSVSDGKGMQFAYWLINDASTGHVSRDIRNFSGAENPLRVVMTHPTAVLARFVGTWEQLPDQPKTAGIVVRNLVEGQTVKVIQSGNTLAEATVANGGTEATIPLSAGRYLNGRIVITAPDGKTVIFESPTYDLLKAGNQFFY